MLLASVAANGFNGRGMNSPSSEVGPTKGQRVCVSCQLKEKLDAGQRPGELRAPNLGDCTWLVFCSLWDGYPACIVKSPVPSSMPAKQTREWLPLEYLTPRRNGMHARDNICTYPEWPKRANSTVKFMMSIEHTFLITNY